MPDFDVDFCDERREEVIEYVTRKYGMHFVSQIITFGTLAAKNVIRSVGRALDISLQEVDKIAKLIPTKEHHITLDRALESSRDLKNEYDSNETIKRLIDISKKLEGMPKNVSTHACGVLITKNPVDTYVPLYVNDGVAVAQYNMTQLEQLGLLKMDFLGLRTLSVIDDCIELVKENRNIDVVFDENMNDQKAYKLWQDGKTYGIFQFESVGITNFMKQLKPDCLEDIIAGVSLYRPGPMDQIPRYIKGKQDPNHLEYTHPALKTILEVTYGCMVYQEQVMQIVRDLAGYSLGRADLVRRAMGKKKLDVMAKEREIFINGQVAEDGTIIVPGCIRNGIDEVSANKIFDEMAEFAKYAFNKSHAVAYAVVSYQTAYLKAYYPSELMAATMNSFLGNLDKIPMYIEECKKSAIEILPPNINNSKTKFTVEDNKIRFGLGTVKNVGIAIIDGIVEEREKNGKYESFTSFCERTKQYNVNKRCIECLIKSGAFDEFGKTRATLLASFEEILDIVNSDGRNALKDQVSMFDIIDETEEEKEKKKYVFYEKPEMEMFEFLNYEKEMLGVYISGHPLEKQRELIENITNINALNIIKINEDIEEYGESKDYKDGQSVKVAGIITKVRKRYTKKNTTMATLEIEDLYGTINILAFDRAFELYNNIILEDNIIFIEGRLSIRDDEPTKIIVSYMKELDSVESPKVQQKKVYQKVIVDITNFDEQKKKRLRGFIKFFAGDTSNMKIFVKEADNVFSCGTVFLNNKVLEELYLIADKENVFLE